MNKCAFVVAVMVVGFGLGGCKKTEQPAGTGSAVVVGSAGSGSGSGSGPGSAAVVADGSGSAGSGSAAPPVATDATCFTKSDDGDDFSLDSFTASDTAATFCLKTESTPAKCLEMDLATGTTKVTAPPAKPAAVPGPDVKQDDKAVQLCKGAACVTLQLPKLPAKPADGDAVTYNIDVSADGKRALATGNDLKGVQLLDAVTGKKQKLIPIKQDDGGCLEHAQFVGDAVYVMISVCAGPGGEGFLYRADGKQFAKIDQVNVYSATPLQLDGDQWAFAEFGGGGLAVIDVKTGKAVRTVRVVPPSEDGPPECETCVQLDGPNMFGVSSLVKTPNGKLVDISAAGIAVIDPKSGKVEKPHPIALCPAKPATK
ncbi:MAG: hypothetical protein H0T79_23825 [Deltaproteobacteria bacterium]|nr:hypothetical protein [Deltaproteobacteria bacterium]